MAVGRQNARQAIGTSQRFDLGAIGKNIGSWFTETALPFLRDKAAPAVLNAIDPTLGETYTQAVDDIRKGKDAADVIGNIADNVTGKVVPKALAVIPGGQAFIPGYNELSGAVKTGKALTGITTAGAIRGAANAVGNAISSLGKRKNPY